jgi:hypothetical protein
MKPLHITIATLTWISLLTHSSIAKPLSSGVFLGPDSHKIQIVSSGDRICYRSQGRSTMVSSVTLDTSHRDIYRLDGIPTFALYQPSPNTLLFGEESQLAQAKIVSNTVDAIDPLLKQCLASKGTFFKQSMGNLGG